MKLCQAMTGSMFVSNPGNIVGLGEGWMVGLLRETGFNDSTDLTDENMIVPVTFK